MIRRLFAFGGLALAAGLILLPVAAMAQTVPDGLGAVVISLLGPYALPVGAVVLAAKAICAVTPTPAPNSPWATIYKGIEWAALIFGKMKQAIILAVCIGAAGVLSACSGTTADPAGMVAQVQAAAPEIFKQGCAAVSIADGSFKAVAPALVAAGKLQPADVDKEAAIFASVQVTCANPPADLASAAPALLGQASAIYLLVAVQ